MNCQTKNKMAGIGRIAAFAALALAGGIALYVANLPDRAPQRATVLAQPITLPEFDLVDQDSVPFNRSSLAGQWSLLFFGFTHCPDICPLTLQKLAAARRQLATRRAANDLPAIVFVSVDPERDTTRTMASYVGAFGPGVAGVTGRLDDINTLTSALGIFHNRPPKPDGGYDVEHSAAVLLINPDAGFQAVFSAPHDVDSFVGDLGLLMDSL